MSTITVGSCQLDTDRRLLKSDVGEAELSPLASRFLQILAIRQGEIVSRSDLIDQLWSGNYLVGDPGLNRLVSETRKAAQAAGVHRLVETIQKTGYRLVAVTPVIEGAALTRARTRFPSWAIGAAIFILVVVGLNWLLDSAMGLIWLSGRGD